jgi:hypothetical protein
MILAPRSVAEHSMPSVVQFTLFPSTRVGHRNQGVLPFFEREQPRTVTQICDRLSCRIQLAQQFETFGGAERHRIRTYLKETIGMVEALPPTPDRYWPSMAPIVAPSDRRASAKRVASS